MRKILNKGHRIRASDKHLVYHFSIGTLLFVFVAVLLLLNIKQLMRTDWEHFRLLENGLTLSPYNFITILIATGVCALMSETYFSVFRTICTMQRCCSVFGNAAVMASLMPVSPSEQRMRISFTPRF